MRRFILFLFLILFFGFSYGVETLTGTAQVGDGDDLVIEGQRIRLHGVDAPEWNQACLLDNGKDFYPGREAKVWLESFIALKVVSCNVETSDKYGRKVSTCFVDGRNINEMLVQKGFAFANEFFSDRYVEFQKEARSDKSGLWRGYCAMPWQWRKKNLR